MKSKVLPSMMCVDFANIEKEVRAFEQAGAEYLHIDIMDGSFVPNFTLGVGFCEWLREIADIPLDIHLMVDKPELKLQWFAPRPGEYMSVHWEGTVHMQRALAQIRQCGARPMAALNPATPVSVLQHVLDDIDAVLLMTVNPGFAGQPMIATMPDKVRAMRRFLDEQGYAHVEIEVDGNISFETAPLLQKAGASLFVGGSSSVFSPGGDIAANIRRLRQALGEE